MSLSRSFALPILFSLSAALAAMIVPGSCAGQEKTAEAPGSVPVLDPIQPVNRALFKVDHLINRAFAGKGRVLATAKWLPRPVRAGGYNVFDNLDEPATLANDLMQVKLGRAVNTAGRFTVNSTLGVFGVLDVASQLGLKRTREDFGQTLATWGVTPGPYVFIPLAGPSTARDEAGDLVDGFFSPLRWVKMATVKRRGVRAAKYLVQPSTLGIRQEARTAAENGETDDEYASLRELYAAQRLAQIADEPNLADNPIAAVPRSEEKRRPKPAAEAGAR